MTTANTARIGTLVLRMQGAFLDFPGLTLTIREAEERFGVDEITCKAVMGVLADAGVLQRTKHGVYSRYFPLGPSVGSTKNKDAA